VIVWPNAHFGRECICTSGSSEFSFSLLLSLSLWRLWENRRPVFAGQLCRAMGKVSPRSGTLNSCCMASAPDGLERDCCAWASGDLARRGEPIWEILAPSLGDARPRMNRNCGGPTVPRFQARSILSSEVGDEQHYAHARRD
jgi:hypothetical protein